MFHPLWYGVQPSHNGSLQFHENIFARGPWHTISTTAEDLRRGGPVAFRPLFHTLKEQRSTVSSHDDRQL